MAASRPQKGHVVAGTFGGLPVPGVGVIGGDGTIGASPFPDRGGPAEGDYSGDDHRNHLHGSTRDGTWRPNRTFSGEHGLKVMLSHQRGVTARRVLTIPFRLQVPPLGDFDREWLRETQKWTTLRRGERSRRGTGRKLRQLSVSTMLLDDVAQHNTDRSVVTWPFAPHPQRMIGELEHIQDTETPFRLTVSQAAVWGSALLFNHVVVLTGVKVTQRNGEVGTEYLDLTFEEWVSSEVTEGDLPARPRHHDTTIRYQVVSGRDDLYEIAKRYYGQPSQWRWITSANGIRGVSPGSEAELAKWMSRHHRRELTIPRGGPQVKTRKGTGTIGAVYPVKPQDHHGPERLTGG